MSFLAQLASQQRQVYNEENRVAKARAKYTSDPGKVDRYIAGIMQQQLPKNVQVKTSKYPTKIDAVDAGFSKNDPRVGLGTDIRDNFNRALASPQFAGTDPDALLAGITAIQSEKRRKATQQYTREQQSSLFGEDVRPLPDYDSWLAKQRQSEKARNAQEGSVSFFGDAPRNAALGAGFAAIGEGVARSAVGQRVVKAIARPLIRTGIKAFGRLAARGLLAAPNPLAKIAGAALLAIPEFYAFEKASEVVARSEWGQANRDSAKVAAAELLVGMGGAVVTGGVVRGGLKRGLKKVIEADLVSKSAEKQLAKFPMASSIINSHQAAKESAKAVEAFVSLADNNTKLLEHITKNTELSAETLAKQDLAKEVGVKLDKLNTLAKEAKHASTVKLRNAGMKSAQKIAEELGKTAETLVASFPELEVFKAQVEMNKLGSSITSLEKRITRAVKTKDFAAIPEYEKKLVFAKDELSAYGERYGSKVVHPEASMQAQQMDALDSALASASDEKTIATLKTAKVILQKELDKTVAKNIAAVSNDGLQQIEKNIASGEAPIIATSKAVKADEVIAAQNKPAVTHLEEAAVKNNVESTTSNAVLEDIKKAIAPDVKKGSIKAPAPDAETISYAKKLRIKNAGSMTKAKLYDAIDKAEAGLEGAAEKIGIKAEKAKKVAEVIKTNNGIDVRYAEDIVYTKDNLPPFLRYKLGELTQKQYAKELTDPAVRRAEYDLLEKSAPHMLGERAKILRNEKSVADAIVESPSSAVIDDVLAKAEKAAKENKIVFEEPSMEELAKLEKSLVEEVGSSTEKTVDPLVVKTVKNAADTETKAANRVVVDAIAKAGNTENAVKEIKQVRDTMNAYEETVIVRSAEREAKNATKVIRRRRVLGKSELKTLLALAGPATGILLLGDAMSPDNADAGIFSSVTKGLFGVAKALSRDALESSITAGKENMQKMADFMKPATAKIQEGQKTLPERTRSFSNPPPRKVDLNQKRLPFSMDRVLSPHIVAEIYYQKLKNPMVEIAGRITAAINDTEASMIIMRNILDAVPGASFLENRVAKRAVVDAMKPLEEMYAIPFARAGHAEGMVKELEKRLSQIGKKAAKGQGTFTEESAILSKELGKFKNVLSEERPKLAAYTKDWENVVKPLAAKYPSTRIALAAEDTAEYEIFPWLKNMLSFEEREATAHLKGMMQEIGGRISDVGGQVIKDRPFMHHAMHPSKNFDTIKKALGDIAYDVAGSPIYSKFHSRMLGSRQMMPEVEYILERYIPDVHKRINMTEFWKKNGWEKHANNMSKNSEALKTFWDTVKDGFKPQEDTFMNSLSRKYTSFEVARLLAGSLSVPFKHLVKVAATMAQLPISDSVAAIPRAAKATIKIGINRSYNNSWILKRLGRRIKLTEQEQFIDGFTKQGNYSESIADLGAADIAREGVGYFVNKVNEVGSIPTRAIELFDRSISVIAGSQMAAKKGMTPQQSLDAIMKMIMQNNFLGGNQNPYWLRNPKIRAVMLFQGTPFKILERRLLVVSRTKQGLDAAGREMFKQLKELRGNIREGETLLKAGLIRDALYGPKDQFGQAYAKTFMKEVIGLGAFVTVGREAANVDLFDHAFHLPVVKFNSNGPTIAMNPILQEAYRTSAYQNDDDFWLSQFYTNYFKGVGLSNTFTRAMRLSKNDIPERYRTANNPKLAYLFAVPGVSE